MRCSKREEFLENGKANASACMEDMVPSDLRWNHAHRLDMFRIARNADDVVGVPEEGTRRGATIHVA